MRKKTLVQRVTEAGLRWKAAPKYLAPQREQELLDVLALVEQNLDPDEYNRIMEGDPTT